MTVVYIVAIRRNKEHVNTVVLIKQTKIHIYKQT